MYPVLAIHLFGTKEIIIYVIVIIAIVAVAAMTMRHRGPSDV